MYSKEQQLKSKRIKPKRGQLTKITQNVRKEVLERSGGCCERCGKHSSWGMEMSHLVQASQGGRGDLPSNIVLLCGPSVQTGTCHHFADHTKAGREWRMEMKDKLENYYLGGGTLD
ncbi:HNH endonuclease [Virgibacillus sp. Bac332]|uniref:HNH endonuclease n=1 Tax=Virgibacillus sp. Bac332 TaxID=2419842 RepID=UPI000EF4F6A3|nr:HNH endonuclease [Virgibacillus sp. Bac332]